MGRKNIKAPNTTICSKLKKDMIKMVQTVGYLLCYKFEVKAIDFEKQDKYLKDSIIFNKKTKRQRNYPQTTQFFLLIP